MTITGSTGGKGTRAIANRDPPTSGLTAGTTKQEGRISNLVPLTSNVSRRLARGIR
jgi:hypothetical protein